MAARATRRTRLPPYGHEVHDDVHDVKTLALERNVRAPSVLTGRKITLNMLLVCWFFLPLFFLSLVLMLLLLRHLVCSFILFIAPLLTYLAESRVANVAVHALANARANLFAFLMGLVGWLVGYVGIS